MLNILKIISFLLVSKMSFSAEKTLTFHDFEKKDNYKNIGFNKNAPNWLLASPGTNIVGKCFNKECAAFSKTVICPLGYGIFLIINKGIAIKDSICPICKKSIKPKTFGFYNCHYRIKGEKPKRLIITQWDTTHDEWRIYDEDEQSEFITVKVETVFYRLNKPDDDSI